jgi:hypothetical protein
MCPGKEIAKNPFPRGVLQYYVLNVWQEIGFSANISHELWDLRVVRIKTTFSLDFSGGVGAMI